MIWIILALILSVALNGLLLWYIRQTLRRLLFASENFGWLLSSVQNFSDHVEKLHELEMFYGDSTLGNLIEHSKQLVDDIKNFEDIYTILEDEPDDREKEEEAE
jgi:tRNA A-37 threonylcarbamoyl transferase component Bud32